MASSFGIGSVLAVGSRIWVRNLPVFVVFGLAFYAPILGFGFVVERSQHLRSLVSSVYLAAFELHPLLVQLIGPTFLLMALAAAAITHRTVTAAAGAPATIGAGFGRALRRLPAIAILALVTHVVVHGASHLVAWLLSDDHAYGIDVFPLVMAQLAELVVSVGFVLALPVLIAERAGVWGALRRGWRLSRGRWLKLFGLGLLVQVIYIGFHLGLRELLMPSFAGEIDDVRARLMLIGYVTAGISLLLATWKAALLAVAYGLARADDEGPTTGDLGRVFD